MSSGTRALRRASSWHDDPTCSAFGGGWVASGTSVASVPIDSYSKTPERETELAAPVRGLAMGEENRLYVGQPDAVLAYDLATGRQLTRIPVPDLLALRRVKPPTR